MMRMGSKLRLKTTMPGKKLQPALRQRTAASTSSRSTWLKVRPAVFVSSILIRIDETKTAGLTFNQVDRDEVLAAVRWRKAGCSFFPGIVVFSRNLLPILIIHTHHNLLRMYHCPTGEP